MKRIITTLFSKFFNKKKKITLEEGLELLQSGNLNKQDIPILIECSLLSVPEPIGRNGMAGEELEIWNALHNRSVRSKHVAHTAIECIEFDHSNQLPNLYLEIIKRIDKAKRISDIECLIYPILCLSDSTIQDITSVCPELINKISEHDIGESLLISRCLRRIEKLSPKVKAG